MIYSDRMLSQKLERTEARSNADFVETRARITPESGATWIEVAGAYAMFDGAMLASGKIAARTAGGLPFLAEAEGRPVDSRSTTMFASSRVRRPFPRHAAKAPKTLC